MAFGVSENGGLVAIATKEGNVQLLNKKGELLLKYKTGHVFSLSVSDDGRYIAAQSIRQQCLFLRKKALNVRLEYFKDRKSVV